MRRGFSKLAVAVIAAVLVAVAASFALAAIPDDQGVIRACYPPRVSTEDEVFAQPLDRLRVLDEVAEVLDVFVAQRRPVRSAYSDDVWVADDL